MIKSLRTTTETQLHDLLTHLDYLCKGDRQKKEVHDFVRECLIIQYAMGKEAGKEEAKIDMDIRYNQGKRDGIEFASKVIDETFSKL